MFFPCANILNPILTNNVLNTCLCRLSIKDRQYYLLQNKQFNQVEIKKPNASRRSYLKLFVNLKRRMFYEKDKRPNVGDIFIAFLTDCDRYDQLLTQCIAIGISTLKFSKFECLYP